MVRFSLKTTFWKKKDEEIKESVAHKTWTVMLMAVVYLVYFLFNDINVLMISFSLIIILGQFLMYKSYLKYIGEKKDEEERIKREGTGISKKTGEISETKLINKEV